MKNKKKKMILFRVKYLVKQLEIPVSESSFIYHRFITIKLRLEQELLLQY